MGAIMAPIFLISSLLLPASLYPESGSSVDEVVASAYELNLANNPTWLALIHSNNQGCQIKDSNFLLSGEACSSEAELIKTIREIYDFSKVGNSHVICRFPARYQFIRKELSAVKITLPETSCKDLEVFLKKAPAEIISLVFASENVTQASSMMGHVFLKISGLNDLGVPVDHAVSYYTEIDSLNLPALIVDSLLLGMPSIFALTPYSQQMAMYLDQENRNIWEYKLALSAEMRQLMHLHIWELKEVKSKYLFAGNNCATVIYSILALANPSFQEESRLWITPLDVVRQADKSKLIDSMILIPSDKWRIRMLASELDFSDRLEILQMHQSATIKPLPKVKDMTKREFLKLELAQVYSKYLLKNNKITDSQFNLFENEFHDSGFLTTDFDFDISQFKNPLNQQEDSQYSIGYLNRDNSSYLKINFLPVSHKLSDDNRQYFSENELELGDLTVLAKASDDSIRLEEFQMFSSTSLIPWDSFTGGISGHVKFGIERQYEPELVSHNAGYLLVGLGFASSIHEDVLLYSLGNVGVGYGDQVGYLYGFPEAGFIINQVFSTKGFGSVKLICGQFGYSQCYQQLDLGQSLFLSRESTLVLAYRRNAIDSNSEDIFELSLRRYF
jgi:hypothetical protein